MADPTDEQLDVFIRARLDLIGVSLDDLPVDDPKAPADQVRILASLRTFLRRVPPDISAFAMDSQLLIPALYPAPLGVWTGTEPPAADSRGRDTQ